MVSPTKEVTEDGGRDGAEEAAASEAQMEDIGVGV